MLYHQLLELARQWMPIEYPVIRAANVFLFPVNPHEVIPKHHPQATADRLQHEFTLPYSITAVEDNGGCLILAQRPGQTGLSAQRMFIEIIRADSSNEAAYQDTFEDRMEARRVAESVPHNTVAVSVGFVECLGASTDGWAVAGTIAMTACFCDGNQAYLLSDKTGWLPGLDLAELTMPLLKNAMTAMEELAHIENLPLFRGWPRLTQPTIYKVSSGGEIAIHQNGFEDRIM